VDFGFYNAAFRALKVLECKISAAWVRHDNAPHYWFEAPWTGFIEEHSQRHGEFLSRLQRTEDTHANKDNEDLGRLAMAPNQIRGCAFSGSMSRVCTV
jgi:hypothetical protein